MLASEFQALKWLGFLHDVTQDRGHAGRQVEKVRSMDLLEMYVSPNGPDSGRNPLKREF